jgi:tRNA (guanosine-2'-O-)-methyltransferase
MKQVASSRIFNIGLLLEDVYQEHNASAILRSCDALGFSNVHTIENNNQFKINPEISMGADKWLVINRIRSNKSSASADYLKKLKSKGVRIAATSLNDKSINIQDLNLKDPLLLIFGTELNGISDSAISQADVSVKLPMHGFTQSYNVSVSVAMSLQIIRYKLQPQFKVSKIKIDALLAYWMLKNSKYASSAMNQKNFDSKELIHKLKEFLLFQHE